MQAHPYRATARSHYRRARDGAASVPDAPVRDRIAIRVRAVDGSKPAADSHRLDAPTTQQLREFLLCDGRTGRRHLSSGVANATDGRTL